MAERRMFAKSIIDSDAFLDMPTSSRLLYFDLSMRADDDGFINNPKKIARMTGASEDDLKLLIAKQFILPFESGVVVVKHWRIHNYIQKDRYKETLYIEEKAKLSLKGNKEYTLETDNIQVVNSLDTGCIQSVNSLDTQVRLGKDRLELGKDRVNSINYTNIVNIYNDTCVSLPKVRLPLSETRKKTIKARLNSYTIDEIKLAFEKAQASDFLKGANNKNWIASFDWILKDGNIAKVLDGNYDNRINNNNNYNKKETEPFVPRYSAKGSFFDDEE